jgi:hypothetical protein
MSIKEDILKNFDGRILNEEVDIIHSNKNKLQGLINSLNEISKSLDILEERDDEFFENKDFNDSMFKARTIQLNDFVKNWAFKVKGMEFYFSDVVNELHRKQYKVK